MDVVGVPPVVFSFLVDCLQTASLRMKCFPPKFVRGYNSWHLIDLICLDYLFHFELDL